MRAFIQSNKIIFHFLPNVILYQKILGSRRQFIFSCQKRISFIMHSIKNSLFS